MITKSELIEYLKHTPENTNYNILYSSLYNGSNKEAVDEFIEVLSRGNLSLAALQPYLAKLYEDDKTISPEPLPPFSSGGASVPKPLTYDYMPEGYPSKSRFNMEWDGNTEGLTLRGRLYKVSDLVVDPSVFASGATLTYADGSTDFMSIDAASGKNSITIDHGKVIFGEGQIVIFTETPEPPFEAFEIGVYFESDEIYDVRKVAGGEVITPIAEEFLPNIPADKLPAGGGSADAVLYTAQTLTDAQKQQARENIDAEIADFVVNGTLNSNMEVTLDKTFAQIQAAVQEGKHPAVHITGMGDVFLPLVNSDTDYANFAAVSDVTEGTITSVCLYITADAIRFDNLESPTLNSDGDMNQYSMEADPISPMEIATKQYVDDKISDKEIILSSSTAGSTKKFKLTIDDTGTLTASEITA